LTNLNSWSWWHLARVDHKTPQAADSDKEHRSTRGGHSDLQQARVSLQEGPPSGYALFQKSCVGCGARNCFDLANWWTAA
jgi:hypothetical protein